MLLIVYEELMLHNKQLEIVFVSCDSSLQSFNEYFAHMPWRAVPFGDEARLVSCSQAFRPVVSDLELNYASCTV